MSDVDKLKLEARKRIAEATIQYGFVRANWGKLSTIAVVTGAVCFWLGAVIF